jgi:hypothetical protein
MKRTTRLQNTFETLGGLCLIFLALVVGLLIWPLVVLASRLCLNANPRAESSMRSKRL